MNSLKIVVLFIMFFSSVAFGLNSIDKTTAELKKIDEELFLKRMYEKAKNDEDSEEGKRFIENFRDKTPLVKEVNKKNLKKEYPRIYKHAQISQRIGEMIQTVIAVEATKKPDDQNIIIRYSNAIPVRNMKTYGLFVIPREIVGEEKKDSLDIIAKVFYRDVDSGVVAIPKKAFVEYAPPNSSFALISVPKVINIKRDRMRKFKPPSPTSRLVKVGDLLRGVGSGYIAFDQPVIDVLESGMIITARGQYVYSDCPPGTAILNKQGKLVGMKISDIFIDNNQHSLIAPWSKVEDFLKEYDNHVE